MDAPRIHHEAKTQSRWALSRQNRRSMGMSVEPEGGSNPRPADYEPAPLCVVGDLWCCLIPACTVVARCSCWAVTARDCQYRDSGYTTDARRQHQSVVVAQWTPPAVVDRHKGGEMAYLAGDILQEAIEAARRGIRRVRRKPQRAAPTHRRDQQQHGNAAPPPCCAPSHVRCTPSKLPQAYRPRAAAHSPRSANSRRRRPPGGSRL